MCRAGSGGSGGGGLARSLARASALSLSLAESGLAHITCLPSVDSRMITIPGRGGMRVGGVLSVASVHLCRVQPSQPRIEGGSLSPSAPAHTQQHCQRECIVRMSKCNALSKECMHCHNTYLLQKHSTQHTHSTHTAHSTQHTAPELGGDLPLGGVYTTTPLRACSMVLSNSPGAKPCR